MEQKGSVGSFGRATASKIAAGKARGGVAKKKAVFAENVKRFAARRRRRGGSRGAGR